jgi:hypothetical protein
MEQANNRFLLASPAIKKDWTKNKGIVCKQKQNITTAFNSETAHGNGSELRTSRHNKNGETEIGND